MATSLNMADFPIAVEENDAIDEENDAIDIFHHIGRIVLSASLERF